MVNVGLSWSSMLGVILAVAGAALYFLRSMRPSLARDHDIFFAAVALLCGGILFFQGWRQDPILQFGQFLLTGSAIFFAVESIRLRKVATEQAKRSTPIVDDERPVSRVYRAELDELSPYEERPVARRIRGSRDGRPEFEDEVDDDVRRRPPTSRNRPPSSTSGSSKPPSNRNTPPRRPRPRPDGYSPDLDDVPPSGMGDSPRESRRPPRSPEPPVYGSDAYGSYGGDADEPMAKPRKRPPVTDAPPRSRPPVSNDEPGDYADYQPIDYSEDEERDNSSNFDDF